MNKNSNPAVIVNVMKQTSVSGIPNFVKYTMPEGTVFF
jgi:hypothetical protein